MTGAKRPVALDLWLYGTRTAVLTKRRPGNIKLQYTDAALERWPANSPILSCSLPLDTRAMNAWLFCSALLPEGQAREHAAARAGLATIDVFDLLAVYGRDVAGAVVLGDNPDRRPGDIEPYSGTQLDADVAELERAPLALYDDSELSLAGIQNKLLLVRQPDGWARPRHGYPSTHILKVEPRNHPGMARAEAGCLSLARSLDLTTVSTEVERRGGADCLIVSRYDRAQHSHQGVTRLHQEDLCQATGRDPESNNRRGKSEAHGGPGFNDAARLLDRYAQDPDGELRKLAEAMIFTVIIGNGDAHGRNLSFIHDSNGQVALAPLYDLVPTVCFPPLARRLAMHINGRRDIDEVTADDLAAEMKRWRFRGGIQLVTDLAARTIEMISVADHLTDGQRAMIAARAENLHRNRPAGG